MLFVFFFNDTATTEIYTLSLHDALPISGVELRLAHLAVEVAALAGALADAGEHRVAAVLLGHVVDELEDEHRLADARDRKSTRLNSSHANISYAVFCLKKKKRRGLVNKR